MINNKFLPDTLILLDLDEIEDVVRELLAEHTDYYYTVFEQIIDYSADCCKHNFDFADMLEKVCKKFDFKIVENFLDSINYSADTNCFILASLKYPISIYFEYSFLSESSPLNNDIEIENLMEDSWGLEIDDIQVIAENIQAILPERHFASA